MTFIYRIWLFFINFIFVFTVLPFFLFFCILIPILNFFYNPGPLFFTQERLGLNGSTFTIIKFRTMFIDAEKNGPQWSFINDPRIPKLGSILRKTRIDELPQIINIVQFKINLIGPRAEREIMVKKILTDIPNFNERLIIKPGITGYAQITSGYSNDIEGMRRKLSEDLYYIINRNILLDIKIIYKTIISVINLFGI